MPISFNEIPSNIRVPGTYIEIDNSKAVRGLAQFNNRFLVLGQRLSSGSVAAAVPTLVTSADQAALYFGRGSQLHRMFKALKGANRFTETWAVALDDVGAGVAATGTIVFSGTVTGGGTLNLYVAGQRVLVAVPAAQTAADTATATAAAINANGDLPVTATASSATVTLTSRHKGLWTNDLDIRVNYLGAPGGETLPAGLVVTVTAMAGGTSNPTVATAFAALPDEIYDYIVMPYTDSTNLTATHAELDSRWSGLRQLEGKAFTAYNGTLAQQSAFGNSLNSEHIAVMGYYNSPTPPDEWASAMFGVAGLASQADPARPLEPLAVPGLLPPPPSDQFTASEQNILLYDGISTFTVGRDGTVYTQKLITTYQVNALGAPDVSYLKMRDMLLLAYLRQSARARMSVKFIAPRYKLVDDGNPVGAGTYAVSPSAARDELIALAVLWWIAGYIENIDQFIADLVVERDIANRDRLNALLSPDLVNGLEILAAKIQFLL